MAVDGVKILESDFALDVYDDFFERYDQSQSPSSIAAALRGEYATEILSTVDEEIFFTALAECLWTVGSSTDDLRPQIAVFVDSDTTADFWDDLYPARKAALKRFLRKIAKPKKTPVRPKKRRHPKKLPFAKGDYLAFEKRNGKRVPVIVWDIEKRGSLRYDFVFPNLSRTDDRQTITAFLQTSTVNVDDVLTIFFSKRRRVPVTTIEHTDVNNHLDRFHRFGNRPFRFPQWQGSSFGYCVTFKDFENTADSRGSRAFANWELQLIGC